MKPPALRRGGILTPFLLFINEKGNNKKPFMKNGFCPVSLIKYYLVTVIDTEEEFPAASLATDMIV
jgi:hypothetical protein